VSELDPPQIALRQPDRPPRQPSRNGKRKIPQMGRLDFNSPSFGLEQHRSRADL